LSDPAGALAAEGLLARVRALVPLVAERAAEAEQQRKPDDGVIEALKASGVFRSFVPKRFGGYEIDLDLFVDVGIALSEACPSTGWITTFYMEHNWLLGMFPAELQEEVFSRQPFVLAPGSVNPKDGTATPKGLGYELTGHWKFGTGIVHADRVLLSGRIATEPDGPPRMFLVRPEDVEVRDTWHVDGMIATGSHDIVANAVYVPEKNVSLRPMGLPGAGAGYLARLPVPPMLSLTAAIPSVGAARRAVELFRRLVRSGCRSAPASSRRSARRRRCASPTRWPTSGRRRRCCARWPETSPRTRAAGRSSRRWTRSRCGSPSRMWSATAGRWCAT
jgi:alkylation response protein AidB-like acyl-CoA dehydrogenase